MNRDSERIYDYMQNTKLRPRIFALHIMGKKNSEIAERFHKSEQYVKNVIEQMERKVEFRQR